MTGFFGLLMQIVTLAANVRAVTRMKILLHCKNPDARTGDFSRDIL